MKNRILFLTLMTVLLNINLVQAQPAGLTKDQKDKLEKYLKEVEAETKQRSRDYQNKKIEKEKNSGGEYKSNSSATKDKNNSSGTKTNNCSEYRTQATFAGSLLGAGLGAGLGGGVGAAAGAALGATIGSVAGKKMQDDCEKVFADKQKQLEDASKKATPANSATKSNRSTAPFEVYTTRANNWDD